MSNVAGGRASMPRHNPTKTKYCTALGCTNPFDGGGSRCPAHAGKRGATGFKARRARRLGGSGDAR